MLARECSDVPKLAENAGEVNDVEINKRCDYEIRVWSLHVLFFISGREGIDLVSCRRLCCFGFNVTFDPRRRRGGCRGRRGDEFKVKSKDKPKLFAVVLMIERGGETGDLVFY